MYVSQTLLLDLGTIEEIALETIRQRSNLFRSFSPFHESIILIADRQSHFETSSFTGLADNDDLAFVTRYNSVRRGKAETATEFSFRSEKRFEDSGDGFRRHAAAGVGNPETAAFNFRADSDFHYAAFGHRIYRVED